MQDMHNGYAKKLPGIVDVVRKFVDIASTYKKGKKPINKLQKKQK